MSDAGESQHSPADSGAVTPGNVVSSPISSSRTRRYKVRAGCGRSNAAGESSEEGADQGFFLDDEGTSVTTEMLAQLRKAYDIPSSVELSLPRPGFRPSQPGSSEVVIHRQSFEYGLWLPIQPFFAQILSGLGVAPAQLSSMAWRNLAGLYILWKEVNPNIADKAWDDFWFVVSGDWGQTVVEDGETYVVPNQFKWAGKWTRDLSRDTDLKSVREYVATNPSKTDIDTKERLAKVGLIPPPSSGALGDEVLTPSSVTRRMAEGSKTDLAFLQLVRDGMAKAAGASSQRATTGSEGSGKSAATSSGLPPRPKRVKKVEGPGWTSQLAVDLGGILSSHFSHASRALPALKQVLELSDSQKGSEVVGLSPSQAIDMASHLFLQGSFLMSQFGDKLKEGSTSAGRVAKLEAQLSRLTQKVKDKDDQISKLEDQLGEVRDEAGSVKTQLRAQVERANELQASVDKLETEAGSNLLHGYHYGQYQVTREFPDLDLHYMDFGFDQEALVAKFGKEQDPADVAGSSRQLTSGHPLNLEVSRLTRITRKTTQTMKVLSRETAKTPDLTLGLRSCCLSIRPSFLTHFFSFLSFVNSGVVSLYCGFELSVWFCLTHYCPWETLFC
ncbi:Glyceraldehyde-3-phosphate dehydrogenase, testis-specific like [Melia azedarach]|uniref:Glyceraldehyde-3-phosphate dehydrogenase, testis-specific like n=1 Tax=Melia azedarach TaxID=155640 RepID=A0ACC1XZW7_MELAZ|nr:Glyceraldehyde-3-phosphate dehydrogenase, testis-specific like [Melia azedarach]